MFCYLTLLQLTKFYSVKEIYQIKITLKKYLMFEI